MRPAFLSVATAVVALGGLLSCSGPQGQRVTPAEMARIEAQQRQPSSSGVARQTFGGLTSSASRLAEQRAQLSESVTLLQVRVTEQGLQHGLQERTEAHAVRRAEQRLMRATRERRLHDELVVPLRVREADLELANAAAEQRDLSEELEALQLLWADTTDAESETAMLLIQRVRDRLERASQAHELAGLRRRELVERVLPAELEARDEELGSAELGLEQTRVAQGIGVAMRQRATLAFAEERRQLDRALAELETESAQLAREGGILRKPGG